MAVIIRLSRRGRKNIPHFFIVVQDKKKSPKASFIEKLGFYNPANNPMTLELDLERLNYWIGQGAQPSDRVSSLKKIIENGGPQKKEVKKKKFAGKFVEEEKVEEPVEQEAPKKEEKKEA